MFPYPLDRAHVRSTDDPESIARRELLEETGIQAETWEYMGRIHTSNCFVDDVCHLFLAKHLPSDGAAGRGGGASLAARIFWRVTIFDRTALATKTRSLLTLAE